MLEVVMGIGYSDKKNIRISVWVKNIWIWNLFSIFTTLHTFFIIIHALAAVLQVSLVTFSSIYIYFVTFMWFYKNVVIFSTFTLFFALKIRWSGYFFPDTSFTSGYPCLFKKIPQCPSSPFQLSSWSVVARQKVLPILITSVTNLQGMA